MARTSRGSIPLQSRRPQMMLRSWYQSDMWWRFDRQGIAETISPQARRRSGGCSHNDVLSEEVPYSFRLSRQQFPAMKTNEGMS